MISRITDRLAYKAYQTLDAGPEANYRWADRTVKNILDGKESLHEYQWAFDVEDYANLKAMVEARHGRLYMAYHDMLHLCVRVEEFINCNNLRQAQEACDKFAEIARRGMVTEIDFGK
jgi:hypothetical protein